MVIPTLSLLVLRCRDIEVSKAFYETLGLSFIREKHGNGPIHYSCEYEGMVFELYPNKGKVAEDNTRLGFRLDNISSIVSKFEMTDSYEFGGCIVHVVTDPDGRKVELSQ